MGIEPISHVITRHPLTHCAIHALRKLSLKSLCKSDQIQLPDRSGKNTINKKTGILLHEDPQNYSITNGTEILCQ